MNPFNAWVLDKLNRFLSSVTGLYIALIVPIVVIWTPLPIQRIENILSSNWLQLWALFVLAIIGNKNSKHIRKIHDHLGIEK
jgi:O-antigen/teichoic acid export membrane protein